MILLSYMLTLIKLGLISSYLQFAGLVKTLKGSYKFTYHPEGPDKESVEIDFTPPFKRFSLIKDLEKLLGVTFPPPTSFDTEGRFLYGVDL